MARRRGLAAAGVEPGGELLVASVKGEPWVWPAAIGHVPVRLRGLSRSRTEDAQG